MNADFVSISPDAVIGEDVEIGYGAVIGDVTIGDGCLVEPHAILGKVPRLGSQSEAAGREFGRLEIGDRTTICAGAIVFAGARVGSDVILGDHSYVRERAVIGNDTRLGRSVLIDNEVEVGARCSIQAMSYLCAHSMAEDDVFIGPGLTVTNDHTMTRRTREQPMVGATLRRACRVGGGVVLAPGVEIGEEAFIAAGAVVTRSVAPRMVAMGVPAKAVREVPDEDLLENWR